MSLIAPPTTSASTMPMTTTATEQSTPTENGCNNTEAGIGCEDEGCKETGVGCRDAMCDFWSSWDEELQEVGKLLFPPSPEGTPPRGGDLDPTITPMTSTTTKLTRMMMDDTPMKCPTTPTTTDSTPTTIEIVDTSISPIEDTSVISTTSQDATEKEIGHVDRRLNIGRRDPSIAVTADTVEVSTHYTPDDSPIPLQSRVNAYNQKPPRSLVTSSPISSSQKKPPRSLVSSHHHPQLLLSGTTICASRDYDDISTIGDPDMSSPNATNMTAATVADTAAAAATVDPTKVLTTPTSKEMSSIITFDPTIIKQGIHQLEGVKKQSAINENFDRAACIKASLDAVYARLSELKRCEKSMRGAALIAEDYALAKRLQLERDVKREQVMRVLYEELRKME